MPAHPAFRSAGFSLRQCATFSSNLRAKDYPKGTAAAKSCLGVPERDGVGQNGFQFGQNVFTQLRRRPNKSKFARTDAVLRKSKRCGNLSVHDHYGAVLGFSEQFGSPSVLPICWARRVWVNWWALPSANTMLPALTWMVLSQLGLSATLSRVMGP